MSATTKASKLNMNGVNVIETTVVMGTDANAYRTQVASFDAASWSKFKKTNKNLYVHSYKRVNQTKYSVTYMILPDGVTPFTETKQNAASINDTMNIPASSAIIREQVLVKDDQSKWPVVKCCNEWIAIVKLDKTVNKVVIPDGCDTGTNVGIVVGVGPGMPNGGNRVPSQFQHGDKIMWYNTTPIQMDYPGFAQPVYLLPERSIVCIL